MKSPKAEKKGKVKTTWDPFLFGGHGATGDEARSLDRSAKSPKATRDGKKDVHLDDDEMTDHQMAKFLPDTSVIGRSASMFLEGV